LIRNSNGRQERAYLISLDHEDQGLAAIEEQMLELNELARTAGVLVVGTDTQRREKPDPALFLGKGKVEALHALKHEADFDLLVVNEELSPRQQRNLEKKLELKDAMADAPPIAFQFLLARAAGADAGAQAREIATALQPREQVMQLRGLHLKAALFGPGSLGEDVEDQLGAVDHFNLELALEVALLTR